MVEDMWTSDESDGEVNEYKKIRGELLREERELMDDVRRDYKSVTSIYGRLLEWRKAFAKQYREAYVALWYGDSSSRLFDGVIEGAGSLDQEFRRRPSVPVIMVHAAA